MCYRQTLNDLGPCNGASVVATFVMRRAADAGELENVAWQFNVPVVLAVEPCIEPPRQTT